MSYVLIFICIFQVEYHKEDVENFVSSHQHKYNNVNYLKLEDDYKEWHARNLGL